MLRKSILALSTVLLGTFAAATASAEDVSFHVAAGPSEVLHTTVQHPDYVFTRNAFRTGVQGTGSVLVNLAPFLSVGPTASVSYFTPNKNENSEASVLWDFDGAVRLQAPHTSSVSPYLSGFGGVDKHGSVFNPGMGAAVGVDFALDPSHTFWGGLFAQWNHVFQTHKDAGSQSAIMNHFDTNTATVGLSLSFDAPVKPVVNTVVQTQVVEKTPVVLNVVPTPDTTPAPVAPVAAPLSVNEKVQFTVDSAALDSSAQSTLATVASKLNANPDYNVVVEGMASAEGDLAHNLALSQMRAASVVDFLANSGKVDRSRMSAVAVGPVGTPGDATNRSVAFVVITLVKKQ